MLVYLWNFSRRFAVFTRFLLFINETKNNVQLYFIELGIKKNPVNNVHAISLEVGDTSAIVKCIRF